VQSKYESGSIGNVFRALDSKHTLHLIGLLLASNDLLLNLDAIGKFPKKESGYFFYNSISIIRELALLVVEIDKSNLPQKFSNNTFDSFEKLRSELTSFHDKSLVKSVLKPIRDVTFHYNFSKSKNAEKLHLLIKELRELEKIEVGLIPHQHSVLAQRYTFADTFRSEFINQFLTNEIVSKITAVSVGVVSFTDSLMADLTQA
jgi:hypothetical protein